MKKFVEPEIQVMNLEVADVITTSNSFVPGPNEGGGF